jgi:rhamnosyltransferase
LRDSSFAVVVLTKNAAGQLPEFGVLAEQLRGGVWLVVDSGSRDGSARLAEELGLGVARVAGRDFDHGRTRAEAVRMLRRQVPGVERVVFLTQDSRPRTGTDVERLVAAIAREGVGGAYGRQLPRPGAGPFEAHARLFNYPDRSEVRSLEDAKRLGIKACFFSDSFAAYRLDALEQVGGFPERAIVGEDVIVAAKLLKAGWKIAYVADACVYHSHDLTPLQEMRRYFDIGVFHARESWILREFGKPEGEGLRFLRSELRYLWQHAPWRMPESFLRAALKYFGYRLGRAERWLPLGLKRWLSLQKHFWDREAEELRARKRAGTVHEK